MILERLGAMMTDITSAADKLDPIPAYPPADSECAPHTQVHFLLRRIMENVQDVVVVLLITMLLGLSLQALWRLALMAFVKGAPVTELLSEIMFVLILTEVYRLLIFYLREHRISVALTVEVALVSTLREIILKGAHEFEWPNLLALSVLIIVLGGILAAERGMGKWRDDVSEVTAH
jgi:uncharacterized membrane protein (DUF373 family)